MNGSSSAAASQLASSAPSHSPPCSHRVQFYEGEAFHTQVVCEFVGTGLAAGDRVVLIATAPHARAFRAGLDERGHAVELAEKGGQLAIVDADQLLSRFMRDGAFDLERFGEQIGAIVAPRASSAPRRLRVYGEMVDVLARSGNLTAACELEAAWNALCAQTEINLLCAYDLASFQHERHTAFFDEICRLHTHAAPTEGYLGLTDAWARLREVARLQQRERVHRTIEEELRLTVNREREARARSEASRAFKELFLTVLGHDLRNPLNAILNTARLMAMEGRFDADSKKRVARLVSSSERMQRMIEQILDATRTRLTAGIDLSLGEPSDLVPLVGEQVQTFRVAHPACLFELRSDGPCLARIDAERFGQVLHTLLDNAVAHGDPQRPITISAGKLDGVVCVRVHNAGRPIPPDTLSLLFDPFARGGKPQGRSSGLGLGLYICQHVVRAHGGNIVVESSESKGTHFEIRLPSP